MNQKSSVTQTPKSVSWVLTSDNLGGPISIRRAIGGMSAHATLLEELKQQETRVWEALRTGDAAADSATLAEDFLGVYPDGFADKSAHVSLLSKGPIIARYDLDLCHARDFGSEFALFSYRALFRRSGAAASEVMYVSSIWRRTADGWINVFGQDIPEAQ